MPESTFCDICTLALFWLLQYLILLGYVVYTVTYITGRELIYCANLALVHIIELMSRVLRRSKPKKKLVLNMVWLILILQI